MALTLADLPRFSPPYRLGGSVLIALGHMRADASNATVVNSDYPAFSRGFYVLILNNYSDPPSALPLRYHELIMSRLVFDHGSLCSQPVDMVLDAELPVELGHLHYEMPKRLDTSLRVRMEEVGGDCEGRTLLLRWRSARSYLQALTLPVRIGASFAVRLFTRAVDVLGSGQHQTRTRIALTPVRIGQLVHVERASLNGMTFCPLITLYFPDVVTELGPPRPSS